jgi:hypothetical protein
MSLAVIVLATPCLAYANGSNVKFEGVATLFGSGTGGAGEAVALLAGPCRPAAGRRSRARPTTYEHSPKPIRQYPNTGPGRPGPGLGIVDPTFLDYLLS